MQYSIINCSHRAVRVIEKKEYLLYIQKDLALKMDSISWMTLSKLYVTSLSLTFPIF